MSSEKPARKRPSLIRRVAKALRNAMKTAAAGSAPNSLPGVGRNPLVDHRAMLDKPEDDDEAER